MSDDHVPVGRVLGWGVTAIISFWLFTLILDSEAEGFLGLLLLLAAIALMVIAAVTFWGAAIGFYELIQQRVGEGVATFLAVLFFAFLLLGNCTGGDEYGCVESWWNQC